MTIEEQIESYLDQLSKHDLYALAKNVITELEMRDEVRFEEDTQTFYWEVNGEMLHE